MNMIMFTFGSSRTRVMSWGMGTSMLRELGEEATLLQKDLSETFAPASLPACRFTGRNKMKARQAVNTFTLTHSTHNPLTHNF